MPFSQSHGPTHGPTHGPRQWQTAALISLITALCLAFAAAEQNTRPLLLNTLCLAGGAALLSLPPAMALALLIHRSNLPGRGLLQGLIAVLVFVPPYLLVAGWEAGFGLQGWFCRWLFPNQAISLLAGWPGAIWIQTLANIPWIVLILGSGFRSIPSELEEQASLDGSPLTVLHRITIPLLWPAMLAGGLAVFVLAASEITITDVYQIRTFAEEIYVGFALGDQLSEVPLRTLPGMLLTGGLGFAALLACAHVVQNLSGSPSPDRWRLNVRPAAGIIWLLLVVTLLALVVVPLVSLLDQAGLQVTRQGNARIRHWSLRKAVGIVASSPLRFREEYAWSFAIAQLTSITVIVASALLAWAGRRVKWIRVGAWSLVVLGLALPGPLLALAFGRWLNRPESDWLFYLYDRTLLLPWLTLSVRLFPFAYLTMELAIRRLSARPFELTRTLGGNLRQELRHAVWPQIGPLVGWLWLILMALSVADLSATILAVPPGVTTVSIRIFNLVHYGVTDQLAGLCLGTIMLFGALAALVIGFWPAGEVERERTL